MRVRARSLLATLLAVGLSAGVLVAFSPEASAQKLECGAGGVGGQGPAGGYGLRGANGGSGTMPNCTQNTNGDASPNLNCHAGGDAGQTPYHAEGKKKQGGNGGVAVNTGSSGNVSAKGGSEPTSQGGLAVGTGTGSATANGRAGAGGVALGIGSGTANSNGGGKGSTRDGRAGNGGSGTMPQCMQNTNGDVPASTGWAADAGKGAGVLGTKATKFGIGGPKASTVTALGIKLAATGDRTHAEMGFAGLALIIGGLLLAASIRHPHSNGQ
jgi:hypothetical protein